MNENDRKILLHYLTDEQYEHVVDVLGSMPYVEMSYKCEVLDDDDNNNVYTTDDIVTVNYLCTLCVVQRTKRNVLFRSPSCWFAKIWKFSSATKQRPLKGFPKR